jgi:Transposase DDE domain group 1
MTECVEYPFVCQYSIRVSSVSRGLDRIRVTFDEPTLVANAGLLLLATLAARLGVERLVNDTLRLHGRIGGALPGRKILTLVHAILAGASHIDHANVLRAGQTSAVLGHKVMAPSTLKTFLRASTFGHVRQLEVTAELLRRASAMGAGPTSRLVVDVDSTICEVAGARKHGASFGYTKVRGDHPLLATRSDTGEVLHARLRKGSANSARGMRRFSRSSCHDSDAPGRLARSCCGWTRAFGRTTR